MSEQHKVSQSALAEELAAMRPVMLRWLCAQGAQLDLAEEVLQQASLRALEKLEQLRDASRLKAWFKQILRNTIRDEYRRQSRLLNLGAESPEKFTSAISTISDEYCACVLKILNQIQPQYAQLLKAICIEEQNIQMAAQALGIEKNNVSVRLFRAKKSALKQLQQQCGTQSLVDCQSCSCA